MPGSPASTITPLVPRRFLTMSSTATRGPQPGQIVARDQAKITYDIYGDLFNGTPLVLVTGATALKADWFELPSLLSFAGRGRGVIALETRGMGQSTLAPNQDASDLDLTHVGTDALDVLHHFHLTKVDILGWSLGSIVVQRLLFQLESTWSERKIKVEGINVAHAILATSFASPLNLSDGRPNTQQPSLSQLRSQPRDWAKALIASFYRPGYAEESDLHRSYYDRRWKFLADTMYVPLLFFYTYQ